MLNRTKKRGRRTTALNMEEITILNIQSAGIPFISDDASACMPDPWDDDVNWDDNCLWVES